MIEYNIQLTSHAAYALHVLHETYVSDTKRNIRNDTDDVTDILKLFIFLTIDEELFQTARSMQGLRLSIWKPQKKALNPAFYAGSSANHKTRNCALSEEFIVTNIADSNIEYTVRSLRSQKS